MNSDNDTYLGMSRESRQKQHSGSHWRPFITRGGKRRHQFRVGIRRDRWDRPSPEYRFIALEWQL